MAGDHPLRSIERSVHERFPRLRRNEPALEEAIRHAAVA
jgi:hypothetical protein